MSDKAGFLCQIDEVPGALAEAEALRKQLVAEGIAATRPSQLAGVFRWQHLALASEAVLAALDHYVAQGGGSRGARAYLSTDKGTVQVETVHGPVEGMNIIPENPELQQHKIVLRFDDQLLPSATYPCASVKTPAASSSRRTGQATSPARSITITTSTLDGASLAVACLNRFHHFNSHIGAHHHVSSYHSHRSR